MCSIIELCMFYLLGMQRLAENQGLTADIAAPVWTISSSDAGLANHINSKVIALPHGNDYYGLEHLYAKHRDSFHYLAGVNTKDDISNYIRTTMVTTPVYQVKPSPPKKVRAIYQVKAKAHLHVVVRSKDRAIITSFMCKKP